MAASNFKCGYMALFHYRHSPWIPGTGGGTLRAMTGKTDTFRWRKRGLLTPSTGRSKCCWDAQSAVESCGGGASLRIW
jgi:hypothetical protein